MVCAVEINGAVHHTRPDGDGPREAARERKRKERIFCRENEVINLLIHLIEF